MRALAGIAAVIALGLMVSALSVAGGDSGWLVPPPEAVAQGFAHDLVHHRHAHARRALSARLAPRTDDATLNRWGQGIRARAPGAVPLHGALERTVDGRAYVRVDADTERRVVVLRVELLRIRGLWVVDGLGEPGAAVTPGTSLASKQDVGGVQPGFEGSMDRQQLDFLLGFQRAATLVNNVLTSPASYAAGRDYLEDVALLHADSEDLMRRGLAVGCLSALGK